MFVSLLFVVSTCIAHYFTLVPTFKVSIHAFFQCFCIFVNFFHLLTDVGMSLFTHK